MTVGDVDPAGRWHRVVLYERERFLLEHLGRFVEEGLAGGEAVLVVATPRHLDLLESALGDRGIDLRAASAQRRYVPLEAGETLAKLLVDGLPDEERFAEVVGGLVERAARRHTRVRAFGEMVTLLRDDGKPEAAIRLEELWDDLARRLPLSILCGYPMTSFSAEPDVESLIDVCARHSHVIPAESHEVFSERDEGARPAAFQQAAARLVAIVESSDDAIVGKTLDGVVTSWNRGAENLFGFTAEEMVGRSISRIIPEDCTDDLRTILTTIRRGERVEHYETQRLHKDGHRIDISLTVSPIRDSRGKIVGASKIARDITQRRRQEAELRREREALDALQGVALALSAELDLERLLQAVTDAARHLAGAAYCAFFYRFADREGGHLALHALSGAPREDFERFGSPRNTPLLAPTFAGEKIVRLDDVTADPRYGRNPPHEGMPEGHLPVRSYLAAPITSRGTVFGGLFLGHPAPGVFTERDERIVEGLAAHAAVAIQNSRLYEAERQLRSAAEGASQAKDEFLAMLGHELRNPLASIRNAALAAGLDNTRKDRSLGIIRRGADQLTRLVDDLLDVARITQGKISLRIERLPLAGVVERAVEATRQLFEERGHHIDLSFPRAPLAVDGDQTRLEQVVVNLLTNAAKYTERGGSISVILVDQGDEAVLRVRDNGIGIPPEMLPRVFDLFAQGNRDLDRAPGGLGIGLTVVRRIVELHAGGVEAHSDGVGKGAEFVVRLPVSTLSDTRSPAPEASAPRPPARVLLIEDNADAAEGMMMLLELKGHHVEVAHDGISGMALAAISAPDVLLVDIGLPGIDGYEVARRIRRDRQLSHVVLVALTGYGRAEDKKRAFEAGFDHHLTKPIALDALNALMKKL